MNQLILDLGFQVFEFNDKDETKLLGGGTLDIWVDGRELTVFVDGKDRGALTERRLIRLEGVISFMSGSNNQTFVYWRHV